MENKEIKTRSELYKEYRKEISNTLFSSKSKEEIDKKETNIEEDNKEKSEVTLLYESYISKKRRNRIIYVSIIVLVSLLLIGLIIYLIIRYL